METINLVYLPLIYGAYILTKHLLHRLQNLPPTPLCTLPFLGHLHLINKPIYRTDTAPSSSSSSAPAAAEDCLSKNDVVFANRPHLLAGKYIGYNYTSLTWSSYGDHWRNLRKISSIEILSTHRLQMLSGIRADEVKSMVRALSRASEERKLVDMKTVLFELTMNVMMRMIAGKRYYGENVKEVEEARRFRGIVKDTLRLATSHVGDFVPLLRWLGVGGVEKGMVELQRRRDVFMQELVEERKATFRSYGSGGEVEGKMKTMIEMLLALQEKEPEYYSDAKIRSLMLVLLIAGTDTSAGTMEWAVSLLLKKAQAEIDKGIGHERVVEEAVFRGIRGGRVPGASRDDAAGECMGHT